VLYFGHFYPKHQLSNFSRGRLTHVLGPISDSKEEIRAFLEENALPVIQEDLPIVPVIVRVRKDKQGRYVSEGYETVRRLRLANPGIFAVVKDGKTVFEADSMEGVLKGIAKDLGVTRKQWLASAPDPSEEAQARSRKAARTRKRTAALQQDLRKQVEKASGDLQSVIKALETRKAGVSATLEKIRSKEEPTREDRSQARRLDKEASAVAKQLRYASKLENDCEVLRQQQAAEAAAAHRSTSGDRASRQREREHAEMMRDQQAERRRQAARKKESERREKERAAAAAQQAREEAEKRAREAERARQAAMHSAVALDADFDEAALESVVERVRAKAITQAEARRKELRRDMDPEPHNIRLPAPGSAPPARPKPKQPWSKPTVSSWEPTHPQKTKAEIMRERREQAREEAKARHERGQSTPGPGLYPVDAIDSLFNKDYNASNKMPQVDGYAFRVSPWKYGEATVYVNGWRLGTFSGRGPSRFFSPNSTAGSRQVISPTDDVETVRGYLLDAVKRSNDVTAVNVYNVEFKDYTPLEHFVWEDGRGWPKPKQKAAERTRQPNIPSGTLKKGTLIAQAGGPFPTVMQVRDVTVSLVKHAQYPSAIQVVFKKKGGRKRLSMTLGYSPVGAIVEGWDVPEYETFVSNTESTSVSGLSITTKTSKFLSASDEWAGDIDKYLEDKKVWAYFTGFPTTRSRVEAERFLGVPATAPSPKPAPAPSPKPKAAASTPVKPRKKTKSAPPPKAGKSLVDTMLATEKRLLDKGFEDDFGGFV
jgi:hypothetical protein